MGSSSTSAKNIITNNNPLKIAIEGCKLLFQKAPTLAIILAVLSVLGASEYSFDRPTLRTENDGPTLDLTIEPIALAMLIALFLIFLFGIIVIGSMVAGIFAFTSAEIAKGREVSFKVAARAMFERLWSFVGLQLLIVAKILLWSLLFIIPGIIMAVRYSLANLSFFDSDKKLSGNAAIKDSLNLTRNAWLTTFASQTLLYIITLGTIGPIIDTGSKAMLYRQFTAQEAAGLPKPKPHVLSWVTLGVSILIVTIVTALLGYAVVNFLLTNIT